MTFERDVVPGVHRIEDAYANWYLLEGDGGLTVVDAGLPASWRSLQAALDELGRDWGDLRALVLTHGHYDHVGFAERLRREHGVPVLCSEEDAWLARHPWSFRRERPIRHYLRYGRALPIVGAMMAAGAPVTRGVTEVRTFGDGEQLDVPGRPRVVATPGHTLGHVALHLPERDAVIAGDAVVMLDPYTGRPGPRLVSRAAVADSRRNWASLERLEALDATTVLTGHGPPWREGAAAAVAQARRNGQR
jgi:glyoxylase-like metal-dependent hydrolase (beta-lactamase superfamily II)